MSHGLDGATAYKLKELLDLQIKSLLSKIEEVEDSQRIDEEEQ